MSINRLFIQIYKDLEAGKLELPTLPDIAIKIRNTLKDEKTPIEEASQLISIDPTLTAYLIKIANSPMYIGVEKCNDVQSAVIRLGYVSTRNIAMSHMIRSMFRPKLRKITPILNETWRNTAKLASLSSVLASRCSDIDPDAALTAGMLQDIGALPIINKLSRIPDAFNYPGEVKKVIDKYCSRVGTLILHKWNFQEELIEVVRSRKDWLRDRQPEADLADLILVARLHSNIGTPEMKQCPRINEIPAFQKLPFGDLGPMESLQILDDAKRDIETIMALLPTPTPLRRKRSSAL